MRLEDYLQPEFVIGNLASESKSEVLAELVAPIKKQWPDFDAKRAHQVLLDRENLGTTGIGDGIAIPHGKLSDLGRIVLSVGRSSAGFGFDSLDGKPVHIVFLVLAPEHVAGMHLRVLAHISRLLKDVAFRRALIEAPDANAMWELLSKA